MDRLSIKHLKRY